MAYKHVIRAKTRNLLNITPSMCKHCTYKDGILKANVVNFYYAVLNVTDLFEIGNTYTVSWGIIHKKSLSQTASVVVYGKSKTDPDKTVFREYRSAITGNNYTFTINDEDFSSISFVELRFFRYNTITTDTESSILNIQVELGSTPTPYTPYNYLQSNKRMIKVSEVCQLFDKSKVESNTISGLTFTNNKNGTWVVNGTSRGPAWSNDLIPDSKSYSLFGHKLLLMVACDDDNIVLEFKYVRKDGTGYGFNYYKEHIYTLTEIENYDSFQVRLITLKTGVTFTNTQATPQLFDLTEMFGAGHEPATVAEFRQRFPNEYYPYSPQCWLTSYKSAVVCKTKNLFNVNNAVVINYNTQQETTDATHYVKDGIVYTDWNNAHIGTCVGIKGNWTLPAGTYTMSAKIAYNAKRNDEDEYRGGSIGFVCVLADGSITRYLQWHHYIIPGERYTYTAEIPEGCKNIMLYLSVSSDPDIYSLPAAYCELMVEQGSTATSYVPYQHL